MGKFEFSLTHSDIIFIMQKSITFLVLATLVAVTFAASSKYAEKVNALIDEGRCEWIQTSRTCGDAADAESHYETYIYKGKRVIITSGVPNHRAEENRPMYKKNGRLNPNRRCSRWQFAVLPLNGTKKYYRESGMGSVGFVESGACLYNHLSEPDGSLAIYYEIDTLDDCLGHSDPFMQYHYHGIPSCVPKDQNLAGDPSVCYHLGYMMDGFPVYGRCAVNGVELKSCYAKKSGFFHRGSHFRDYYYDQTAYDNKECQLDEANGYPFPDGTYGYVMTVNFAQTPTGYMGSTDDSLSCGFPP